MVSKNSILPTYRFFVLIFLLYPWFGSIRSIQLRVPYFFISLVVLVLVDVYVVVPTTVST